MTKGGWHVLQIESSDESKEARKSKTLKRKADDEAISKKEGALYQGGAFLEHYSLIFTVAELKVLSQTSHIIQYCVQWEYRVFLPFFKLTGFS